MKRFIAIALFALVSLAPTFATAAVRNVRAEEPAPTFSSTLAQFISYSDDVQALTSWYETLSPSEQATYTAQYTAALDKRAAMEAGVAAAIIEQLGCGCADSNLYLVFDTVKGMDPIKARKVFSSLVNTISAHLNGEYLSSPSNPDVARRARDMQAVRAYIGHQN